MLYSVFLRARCRRRFAAYSRDDLKIMDAYCNHLISEGYRNESMQLYVRCVEHLTVWLRKRMKRGLSELRQSDLMEFQIGHLPRCRCQLPAAKYPIAVRAALSHLKYLLGLDERASDYCVAGPRIVDKFVHHLDNVSGLASATCSTRRRYAIEFLHHCFGSGPIRWQKIQNEHVIGFVTSYGNKCSAATASQAAIALRSFLRFLQMRGMINPSLIAAVPHIATWRLSGLPQVMNELQIRQFLKTLKKNENSGRRDLSIGLCQVVLGLRVCEVASLKLSDIDWRQSVLTISGGKTQRIRMLPLTPIVQNALADYVLHERPRTSCTHLFIRYRPPIGAAVSRELIRGIVRRAYSHVDGGDNWSGTHLLRRTAATRIHQQGVKLKEVADILGHLSIDTTSIYTKVDIPTLRKVALPWPVRVGK